MSPQQHAHMKSIQITFNKQLEKKYEKGAKEHGGNLWERAPSWMLDQAIEEALDQYVYLITLKQQMEKKQNETTPTGE